MAVQSVKLTQDFKQRVARLVERKRDAEQSFKGAISAYLNFCREYFKLHGEAKTRAAKAYLYQQTGLDEPTLRSTYQRIGEHFGVLRKHIALLPPSQESLKELARAETKREGTIERLVKKGTLTPDTSVSDIRKLLRVRKRPIASTATAQGRYVVVLTSSNRAELLERIATLLTTSNSITATINDDKPLHEDGKVALGKWYGANEKRFTLTKP
jgi:hypothetical protein